MTNTTTRPAEAFGSVRLTRASDVELGSIVVLGGTVLVVTATEAGHLAGTVVRRGTQDCIDYAQTFVAGRCFVVGWMDPTDWTVEYARYAMDLALGYAMV